MEYDVESVEELCRYSRVCSVSTFFAYLRMARSNVTLYSFVLSVRIVCVMHLLLTKILTIYALFCSGYMLLDTVYNRFQVIPLIRKL